MRERLLITTAVGLMLGTCAFAQSPNEQPRTKSPPAGQSQTNSNSSAPSSLPSAQNTQSTAPEKSPTTTSQSAPNSTGNAPAPSQAQSNQASPPSQAQSAGSDNSARTPAQAQSNQPSNTNQAAQPSNSPNQAQTNTAPPANNQTQTGVNTNNNAGTQPSTSTAAQPSNNQTNTAQSRSSNVNISANLNERERTRVTESISRLNIAPVNNVNFSLSVGTAVPRDVRFQPLPADVVEVMPQYRGYNFFVVRDDVVIVDPSTSTIVDVLPRTGQSTAAAPASRRTTFSDSDREVIRKHARSSRATQPRVEQRATTGSTATSTRVRVGDRLPDSVEVRSFPDEVYRESPTLREYRYIERDNRTYVVEPHERTIIEEIE
jgi:Protein of unknown function (DUF1236)